MSHTKTSIALGAAVLTLGFALVAPPRAMAKHHDHPSEGRHSHGQSGYYSGYSTASGNGYRHGFHGNGNWNRSGYDRDSPHGWDRGRKRGWGGDDRPPGQRRNHGRHASYQEQYAPPAPSIPGVDSLRQILNLR